MDEMRIRTERVQRCCAGFLMSYVELKNQHVKGRKEYRCEWCGQSILYGEVHLSRVYVIWGEITSGRMHLECERAMVISSHDAICDGWVFGEFKRGEKA
jgi:hypothetical protein